MTTNFFKNVDNLTIKGGAFTVNIKPDHTTNTTIYDTVHTMNDNSKHTTNYGSYTNYGQHATDQGQIHNYGLQRTNGGPTSGYRQHGMNRCFDDYTGFPGTFPFGPAHGQTPYTPPARPYRRPGQTPSDKAGQPTRAKNDLDPSSPEFEREYNRMSPKMKAYLRNLGFDRDRSVGTQEALNEGRSHTIPDDSASAAAGLPFWNERKTAQRPRSRDFDEEEPSDAETLKEMGQTYGRATVFNDNRVVTTNINSNNVNTKNIHDSYNDNSTRTDITKSAR